MIAARLGLGVILIIWLLVYCISIAVEVSVGP
jgi:hypothetical protein